MRKLMIVVAFAIFVGSCEKKEVKPRKKPPIDNRTLKDKKIMTDADFDPDPPQQIYPPK